MESNKEEPPSGRRLVCVPWFRHWKTGKIIRKKNGGLFCFYVND